MLVVAGRGAVSYTISHTALRLCGHHGRLGIVKLVQVIVPPRSQGPDCFALVEDVENPSDHLWTLASDESVGAN